MAFINKLILLFFVKIYKVNHYRFDLHQYLIYLC